MERPKLTSEQVFAAASTMANRHETYKKAHEYLGCTEKDEKSLRYPYKKVNSLCWAISLAIMPECGNIEGFDMSLFPEVYAHKPIAQMVLSAYWFKDNEEGYQKRREILLSAIEETKH